MVKLSILMVRRNDFTYENFLKYWREVHEPLFAAQLRYIGYLSFAIIPGRFEDFKTLMAAIVDATQKNEPGTLNYEWAISDERQVCHVYERYQDSAAPHDPSGVVQRELCRAINGSGEARTPGCLWHPQRTVEGWPRRIGPRLRGALRGL
jgi:hypothetical protein